LLPAPRQPDDLDCLLERVHGLLRGPSRSAHRSDPVPERASAEPELEPALTEDVDRRCGVGQRRRKPERQIRDIGHELDRVRAPCDVGEQRERVEEAALVGVVLDAEEIEPQLLGCAGALNRPS
jgi:hypothetical protein